jgi:hypothetical protein
MIARPILFTMRSIAEWLRAANLDGACAISLVACFVSSDHRPHCTHICPCHLVKSFPTVPVFLPSEAREKVEEEQNRSQNPSIREQFADAKRELTKLSASDWENIPESVRCRFILCIFTRAYTRLEAASQFYPSFVCSVPVPTFFPTTGFLSRGLLNRATLVGRTRRSTRPWSASCPCRTACCRRRPPRSRRRRPQTRACLARRPASAAAAARRRTLTLCRSVARASKCSDSISIECVPSA